MGVGAWEVDGSYPVEKGAGGTSCFGRKLELTTVRGQMWTEEFLSIRWRFPGPALPCALCGF